MCKILSLKNLNLNLCPQHPTRIYICEIITTSRCTMVINKFQNDLEHQLHKDMDNIGNLRPSHKNPYLGKEVLNFPQSLYQEK